MSQAAAPIGPSTSSAASTSSIRTVPDAFRAIVTQHPDHLALGDSGRSITYREFDLASNGAAQAMLGFADPRPLVVVAPLTIDTLTLVFGALKSGRLVVPLDPRWPSEQWLEVTRSTGGALVVPDDIVRSTLPQPARADALLATDLLPGDASDPQVSLDPDAPAFIFFTSGSTGAPKGTVVGHGMPMRALQVFDGIRSDDRLALLAPLSFITGALGATGVLLTGASGHFFDATTADFATLPGWLHEQRITLMGLSVTITAMLARALNDEGRALESVRFLGQGGEAGSAQHFADARRAFPNAYVRHGYGLTETGPVAAYEVGSAPEAIGEAVPVGHPWPWLEVEIVDDEGRSVPAGVPGEIWVTGHDVAFRYWEQPALTAERFVTRADGRRTVRTGDRGRFRPDGMLEHLGRLDRQVKVNAQLVDLSLVEREVEQLAGVRIAVVSAVPTEDGGHRVVAHVVVDPTQRVTVGELRRGLADRLPPYAIPRAFFRIEDVPQTNTGKVDRVWLRESAVGALPLESPYVAPRDERERAVARLFEEVLAVESVGALDDFFELGGDSLSVVELLAGVSDDLGLDLSLNELLSGATVEAIAGRVAHAPSARDDVVVRVNDGTRTPVFCIPGAANTPLQLRPLARRLRDVEILGLAYHGMEHRALPDRTVAAIARRNVAAMRAVDPAGPYRILGYSFGGTVALAMAQHVVATGGEVELLVLLEPSLPTAPPSLVERGRSRVTTTQRAASSRRPGSTVGAWAARGSALARDAVVYTRSRVRTASVGVVARSGTAQHDVFMSHHRRMLRVHRPEPYRGRTVVIGSPQFLALSAPVLDRLLTPETAGGQRRDVAVVGEHDDVLREPNVAEVARVLDLLLADG